MGLPVTIRSIDRALVMRMSLADHLIVSGEYNYDDDGSYSDDFDGGLEAEHIVPGESHDTNQERHDEACSVSTMENISSPARKLTNTNGRKLRIPKAVAKAASNMPQEPRTHSMELARQYGSMNLQDRLAHISKRLKHEQKENSRLRDALLQLQRSQKSPEFENEKADLKRQLKESKSEIKTLKTELRRYETAQAEYQQSVSDYPERIRSLTKDLRQSKEKCNELLSQHRDNERQIRVQHDKICTLQKQLQGYSQNAKKGNTKPDLERNAWLNQEKEYRRQITDLKSNFQKEQKRNRRMSTSMKTMRDQFEGEIIRLGNLLKEKDRKLSNSVHKFSITGQREGAPSRSDALRLSMTSREGDHDIDILSNNSDIAQELQTSLQQIKSAFPSESGSDPIIDDNIFNDYAADDFAADDYEEDFDE